MKAIRLEDRLEKEYKMKNIVRPFGEDVTFWGTELECYRLAYVLKNKTNIVKYSPNINSWTIIFPIFFTTDMAQNIS